MTGIRSDTRTEGVRVGALAAAGVSLVVWIRAKTLDQRERGARERRSILIGLAAPTLWLAADAQRRTRRRPSA